MSGSVSFVLCVDTEGPLYESVGELFKRLKTMFDLDLEPTKDNLEALQRAEMPLGGVESSVQKMVSPKVRDRIDNWNDIVKNVRRSEEKEIRKYILDDNGRGIVFNWFICDWVGFSSNPRRKTLGVNAILSNYVDIFGLDDSENPLYFHHHGVPNSGFSNHPCKNWSNTNDHIVKISANLLNFGFYSPCVRTPIMAPDIHLFLEQYFPFDLSNTSGNPEGQPDVLNRRFADWTDAPADWSVYKPDLINYQKPGSLNRTIGRSLQLGSRFANLDRGEIELAFSKARTGENVLMSAHFHDWTPVDNLKPYFELILEVRQSFQDVSYYNSTSTEAFRRVLELEYQDAPIFDVKLNGKVISCSSDKEIFGAQPWFCYMTLDGKYYWDNLDRFNDREWQYCFDEFTVDKAAIKRVAFAANDKYGNITTSILDVVDGKLLKLQ